MANQPKHLRSHGWFLIIFVGVLISGCAGFRSSAHLKKTGGIPAYFELDGVPFFPQKAYQCGPAALAEALRWSGLSITPEQLTDEVFSPEKKGSLQAALETGGRTAARIPRGFPAAGRWVLPGVSKFPFETTFLILFRS